VATTANISAKFDPYTVSKGICLGMKRLLAKKRSKMKQQAHFKSSSQEKSKSVPTKE
jgi:hypothetical protein